MSILEKLFVEIFERRDLILEQVQQQADSYIQQLAFTLVIDGITPPPWLLNHTFNHCSSDPNELEKEEIISKLLLRPLREPIHYPTGGRSLYSQPVVAGGNGWLSNEMCMETHAPSKDPQLNNVPTTLDCHNNDIGCSLNCVTEQDDIVSSPQNGTDARISNIYAAPDTSLARIQRSRSRQKARELRTNVKTSEKSCLSNESSARVSCTGDLISKIEFHQLTEDKQSSELDKCNIISKKNSMASEGEVYHGGIMRSRSSSQQPSGINKSSKLGTSASCNPKEGRDALRHSAGDSMHGPDAPIEFLDAPETSQALNDRIGQTKAICSNEGVLEPVISTRIVNPLVTQSGSGSLFDSTNGASRQENADIVVGNEPIDVPVAKQSVDSGVMLDLITLCAESEELTLRQPSLGGGYAAEASITRKTEDTQRHSKVNCGRVTRSRSTIRQTSGMNEFSKLGTSSDNSKEGRCALPHSVGELMHGLDAFKCLDALETSQVLNDRIRETQAICSNKGVLKPVKSSNIAATRVTRSMSGSLKESTIGANQQETVEIVVGNGSMDAPVAKQSVSSGIKLDCVTLCTESEGLASRQPSGCCMKVKPKQLNFDEPGECDLNEICCPLAKKSKLETVSGNECGSLNESASSIDHKCTSTFVKRELPTENVLSSKSKAASTHYHDNIDECEQDETINIGLDMNKNPLAESIEHNSKASVHDDINVPCEGDLGHRGEESAAGVYVPVPDDIKSSFVTSLTKQGNDDVKDCSDKEERMPEQDLGTSESKELEVRMDPKLSNMKNKSAKFNTWPRNLQRNVKGQSSCFSDSRGSRLHIQKDVLHCDLEEFENNAHCIQESASVLSSEAIHVSQSDGIQICDKRVHDGMMCDMPEGTESLHELQVAEATAMEVDADSTETTYDLEQSGPTCILNPIKNAADCAGAADETIDDDVAVNDNNNFESSLPEWVSHLETDVMPTYDAVRPSLSNGKTVVGYDDIMPVYEGFVIDKEVENERTGNDEGKIDFDTLEIPNTTITRASILEQICKSSSMQTPLSEFSSTFKQHTVTDLYGFMADGLLEHMDPISTVPLDEDSRKHLQASGSEGTEVDSTFLKLQKFDPISFSSTPFGWQSKKHYSSPIGKLWERSASSSGSSEMRLSSNQELTCFPIEEDPSGNDESENADEASDGLQENRGLRAANDLVEMEMEIPREQNDNEVFEIQEGIKNDIAEKESPPESATCSQHVDPVSMSMKYYDRCSSDSINVELSFPGTQNEFKHKPKNHPGIKVSRFEVENRTPSNFTSKRGNVSLQNEYGKNKSSMRNGIPKGSQKEAKRNNNIISNITSFVPIVQQKQAAAVCPGKRDIKVKALEAAEAARRREEEKENERKMKKEALKLERARIEKENARELELNKKRKQEELKKKEADMAAKKRRRVEDERKQMAKKRKHVADTRKDQKLQYEKPRAGKVESEKQHGKKAIMAGNKKGTENQRRNQNADENSLRKEETTLPLTSVPENLDARGNTKKETSILERSPVRVGPVKLTGQESSYDISPYRTDDEDADDDEAPTKKFVPSWASKSRVAAALALQQNLNPDTIFPIESFCSMDEVLLPRRLQAQQGANVH